MVKEMGNVQNRVLCMEKITNLRKWLDLTVLRYQLHLKLKLGFVLFISWQEVTMNRNAAMFTSQKKKKECVTVERVWETSVLHQMSQSIMSKIKTGFWPTRPIQSDSICTELHKASLNHLHQLLHFQWMDTGLRHCHSQAENNDNWLRMMRKLNTASKDIGR